MATGLGGRAPDLSVIRGTLPLQAGVKQGVETRLRKSISVLTNTLSRSDVSNPDESPDGPGKDLLKAENFADALTGSYGNPGNQKVRQKTRRM